LRRGGRATMSSLPPRSRTRQVFYRLSWETAQTPQCKRRRDMPLQATIHGPFYWSTKGRAETFHSSRMPRVESARSTGWPIATRLFAGSHSCSGLIKPLCPRSQRKRFASPREQVHMCLRHQTRVARRHLDNPLASTTCVSATSKCLQTLEEACISNSAASTRQHIFPPGRCWRGKSRGKTSRAGSSWSGPALLACSTYGQPQSKQPYPESIFTCRCSSIC